MNDEELHARMLVQMLSGSVYRPDGTPLTEEQRLLRKKVLYQIENDPASFSMQAWEAERSCGTTRCLAGWALYLAGSPAGVSESNLSIEHRAIRVLGLTRDEYGFGRFTEGFGYSKGLFYLPDAAALERLRELCSG